MTFTFIEGQIVRYHGAPAKVVRIRLDGTVDLWTDYGLRTVLSDLVRPAKRGDSVLVVDGRSNRKAGTR